MPSAEDIEQLARIEQVLHLRIAEAAKAGAGEESSSPSTFSSSQVFDALSTRLLLWQNRLQELTRQVQRAEQTLIAEDEQLRKLVQSCSELNQKLHTVPSIELGSYT
ncbi:hypothetical protein KIH39_05085 [Telmatocola sphagniphila]|uniref:Uncharacterized protein n=1 Tax=Telmatocola sphagniphila TaxID=1123043 RepID=A0A8E6EZ26_9BACT|nr:hypothetical protein [Telmatocola sphagniphila]QVL33293.1 hypothetical protein KIH39_05085 [Telmatocola sphagniphila]